MKRLLVLMFVLVGVTPVAFAGNAMGQGNAYAGGQFAILTYDEDGVGEDANPTALIGRIGYFVANQVALEGRLGIGLADDTVTVTAFGTSVDVGVELDRLFGFYVVGYLPLAEVASVYGLIGYTDAKATFSANGFSMSETDSGLSYGVGAEFHLADDLAINGEYIRYLDESGYDLSALSFGLRFNF